MSDRKAVARGNKDGVIRTVSVPKNATFEDIYQLLPHEWDAFPTLSQGHDANLKFENEEFRVWVSRMSPRDYDSETNREAYSNERLQVERKNKVTGAWQMLDRYGNLK